MTYGIGGTTEKYNTHVAGTGGYCSIIFESEVPFEDYQYIKQKTNYLLPKRKITKYYKWGEPNLTVVGSPNIENGIVSGFTTANYATACVVPSANSIEFGGKFSYSSNISDIACIFDVSTTNYTGFNIAIQSDSIRLWTNSQSVKTPITVGQTYWFRCECDSSGSVLYLSEDGQNYGETISITNNEFSSWTNSIFSLGVRNHNKTEPFTSGSIYLEDCYMKVNNKDFWTGLKIEKATSTNCDFSKVEDCYFAYNLPEIKTNETYNGTIKGYPSINDNVFSNFSASNYIQILGGFNVSGGKTFEMVFKIKTGENITTTQSICGNTSSSNYDPVCIEVKSSHFVLNLSKNTTTKLQWDITGTYTVLKNTDYYVKATFDGSVYGISYSLDGKTYIQDATYSSTTSPWTSNLVLGRQQGADSEYPFLGSIDLKGCYININGNRIWTGTTKHKKVTNKHLAIKE